jgi:NADPH-dependent 2,4-dienoyl-CoA reductase/sulfur reductase-like enzyme
MAASAAIFPMPAVAQDGNARVVVVGGGFGGAACARTLRRANPRLSVTLVETNRTFAACPMSNAAIAGLRDLKLQDFGYDQIAATGVSMEFASATTIDPAATNAWCSHRASIFAGMRCRVIRLPLLRSCLTRGGTVSRLPC